MTSEPTKSFHKQTTQNRKSSKLDSSMVSLKDSSMEKNLPGHELQMIWWIHGVPTPTPHALRWHRNASSCCERTSFDLTLNEMDSEDVTRHPHHSGLYPMRSESRHVMPLMLILQDICRTTSGTLLTMHLPWATSAHPRHRLFIEQLIGTSTPDQSWQTKLPEPLIHWRSSHCQSYSFTQVTSVQNPQDLISDAPEPS